MTTPPFKAPLTPGEAGALLSLVLAITQGNPDHFDATMQRLYPAWLVIRSDLEK